MRASRTCAGTAAMVLGDFLGCFASMIMLLGAVGLAQGDAVLATMVRRGLTLWMAIGMGAASMVWLARSISYYQGSWNTKN